MSASIAQGAPPRPAGGLWRKISWHSRHDPKFEMVLLWYVLVVFYNIFGIVFIAITRVMPPPKPWWSHAQVAEWFSSNQWGLTWGFGVIFLIAGLSIASNGLNALSMRRMSISPVFSYSYIIIYAMSAILGMLFLAILCSVAAMRPDRDPAILSWLYDAAMLTFNGTMGFFMVGTVVWMIAIFIDKNNVLPKWFGYLQICNAITEFVISPAWIIKRGPFAWNGMVTFWIDTLVFAIYTGIFITLMRKMIEREDFGDGKLPEWGSKK